MSHARDFKRTTDHFPYRNRTVILQFLLLSFLAYWGPAAEYLSLPIVAGVGRVKPNGIASYQRRNPTGPATDAHMAKNDGAPCQHGFGSRRHQSHS
jgi:hypothetical protein